MRQSGVVFTTRSVASMKYRMILAGLTLAACLTTACSGAPVYAPPPQPQQEFSVTITVDENGNGLFTNTSGFISPLPVSLVQDPGPGGLPGALTYDLLGPPGLTAGDLLILEPGSTGVLSDQIRFNPNQGTGSLVFYSDTSDGNQDRADIGFPTALYTNNLAVFEVGPEGNNGFSYTPTAGQPGFVAGAGGPVTFVLQSDVLVPEPASIVLGGIGISIGLAYAYVRRGRR
jgi:hypothetical protein